MDSTANQFPHLVLINQSGLKLRELSVDVKNAMGAWERSYKGWGMKKSPQGLEVLISQSKVISQHIYDYFVEEDDQTAKPGDVTQMAEDIKDTKDDEGANGPAAGSEPVLVDEKVVKTPTKEVKTEKKLSSDETALKTLFEQGKVENISIADLKTVNFGLGIFGQLTRNGCRVGEYELIRSNPGASTYIYKLIKK